MKKKEHPEATGKSKSDVRELRKIWRRMSRHHRKGMDWLRIQNTGELRRKKAMKFYHEHTPAEAVEILKREAEENVQ